MIIIKKILVATDFSDYAKEALDYAVYLAKNLEAEIYLVHVFEIQFFIHAGVSPSIQPEVYKWIERSKIEVSKMLKALVETVQQEGVKTSSILKEGTPFLEILKTAKEVSADLIVLGTHGRTGLSHVMMGSVAERVVRKSTCPVFTVRPKTLANTKVGEGV
ncbi:MAG: universal stress protein [Nitrospira sp.]|nr:universal stress protein [Nitrospira sp.]